MLRLSGAYSIIQIGLYSQVLLYFVFTSHDTIADICNIYCLELTLEEIFFRQFCLVWLFGFFDSEEHLVKVSGVSFTEKELTGKKIVCVFDESS